MTAAQDSRAQFESVASDNGEWPQAIERTSGGTYKLMSTEVAWSWWQASRAALSAEPVAVPQGWKITEEMHVAAVKVLHRASGVDGLPQRILDAMLAAAPQPAAQERKPLTDAQVDDLHGEANRGFDIERDDYFKAFRDAERAHGITGE